MKSEQPLKIGIIGAGGIAAGVHLPSLKEIEGIEIVAICDLVAEKATRMAAEYRIPRVYTVYHELLARESLDAVFVLVEPANLFHVVWHCLDAKIHTYMEKPPGITLYQAESLRRKAEEVNRFLQVGFNRRHIPLVKHVKQLVEARTQITQVEGCFFKFGTAAFDRGSLSSFYSDTIHAVDLVRYLAGGKSATQAAMIGAQHDDIVENAWNGICRFENGVTGIIKANYRTGGRVHQFALHGPGLSAFINLGFGDAGCDATLLSHLGELSYSLAATGAAAETAQQIDGKALAGSTEFHKYYGFYFEDLHFIECVRTGTQPETSIQDAVESMRLVEFFDKNRI